MDKDSFKLLNCHPSLAFIGPLCLRTSLHRFKQPVKALSLTVLMQYSSYYPEFYACLVCVCVGGCVCATCILFFLHDCTTRSLNIAKSDRSVRRQCLHVEYKGRQLTIFVHACLDTLFQPTGAALVPVSLVHRAAVLTT